MRRDTFSLLAALTLAGTVTFAQQTPAPGSSPAAPQTPQAPAGQVDRTQPTPDSRSQSSATPDVTLTGCLVQGSGPTVYILENAKTSTAAASDKGKSYVVTLAPSSTVDFRAQLNHQVRIVGTTDDKGAVIAAPSAGAPGASATVAKMDEKDMPRFSTRTITRVADTCASAG